MTTSNDFVLLIPGVTVPLYHFIYFLIAVVVASIVHESGHAFACNLHGQHVDAVGYSLYFCLPMVFVRMEIADHLSNNKEFLRRKLEIFTAALLNNASLCVVCYALMFINPFSILYKTIDNGLVVSSIEPVSESSSFFLFLMTNH